MAYPLSGTVSSSPKSGGGQADFQGSFPAVDFSELWLQVWKPAWLRAKEIAGQGSELNLESAASKA